MDQEKEVLMFGTCYRWQTHFESQDVQFRSYIEGLKWSIDYIGWDESSQKGKIRAHEVAQTFSERTEGSF